MGIHPSLTFCILLDAHSLYVESVRSRGIDLTKASLDIYVLKDDKLFLYQHTEEQPKLTEVDLCTAFRNVRYILSTVPVDRSTKTDAILQQPMLFAQLKKMALQGEIHWGGYLSTTSVYGNHDGGWVDEDTVVPFDSLRPRGKLRKTAEDAWQFSTGMPMHIFRLPGIYGPGRGPLNRARKGAARCVVKEGQVFSRIHVDDIVGVLMASMLVPNPGRIYNVVDDLPTESYLVTEHACELLGVDRPLRESFDVAKESMSPMAKSFYGDSKRVRSDRIKRELGYSLKYPTYKEGLKAQLDEEDASGWTLVEPLAASKQEVTPSSTGAKSSTTPTTTASSKQQSSHLAQPTIRWLEWVSYAVKAVTQLFGLLSGWVQALSTQLMGRNRVCLLVDNGSLRPEPALQLRKLAESLEQKAASKVSKVIAVSARHSCKIPQEKLDGRSAPVLEELLEEVVKAEPFSSLIVLPYFLGPSKTVTSFLPNTIEAIKAKTKSNFVAKIAAPLVDVSCEGYEESGVVEMLEKAVSEKLEQVGKVPVILVDHGTPSSQVSILSLHNTQ